MPASTASRRRARSSNTPAHSAKQSATKPTPMTPEDLLRFELLGDPQISPDGSSILFTRKVAGKKSSYDASLWTASTSGRRDERRLTNGTNDGNGRWSPDGTSIAFLRGAKGQRQVHLLPVDGGEARALTSFPEGDFRDLCWSPEGDRLAVAFRPRSDEWTTAAEKVRKETDGSTPPRITESVWYRLDGDGYFQQQRFALYVIDVNTGDHSLVYDEDTLGGFTFDFSPDGTKIAITTNTHAQALSHPEADRIRILDLKKRTLRDVPGLPKGAKTQVRWSPDGKLLAYAGRLGTDGVYSTENLELFICDPARGKSSSLTAKTDHCLLALTLSDTAEANFAPTVVWSADSRSVLTRIGHHGEGHLVRISVDGRKFTWLTSGACDHVIGNVSRKTGDVALLRGNAITIPEVAVATPGAKSARIRMRTARNAALLAERAVVEPTEHWIEAEDGTKVQVWVMEPPRARRRRGPAILQIHGGPHAQYGTTFFHEFQTLVSAGYTVFFSNPRGSKGYGRDFCHAIRGAWGTVDWIDIKAVTSFMQSHPAVDPARMGVMGGSYGGYMTNWVIGSTDVFAGAITDRCVSNLVSMAGNSDYPFDPDRYWVGNFWDRPEQLWASSPIRLLGNATTPTLIIHSEGDLRCNIEQAEQVFTVLQLNNVPSRFVRYPNTTSHGLSRNGPPDLRIHRLQEILDWWKRWLH